MSDVSVGSAVGSAVGSGFRLVGREPTAVLGWLALYVVYAGMAWAIILVGAPGMFTDYLEFARQAAEGGKPDVSLAMQMFGKVMRITPLLLLLGLAFNAALLGAIYRAVLQPEARRYAYVRFGRQELWLLLSMIVLALLLILVSVIVTLPFNIVGVVVVGLMAVSGAAGVGMLVMFAMMLIGWLLVMWIAVRLALALPIAFEQSRFVVFEGWRISRGHNRPLFLVALALLAILVVVECVMLGVLGLLSGQGLLAGTAATALLVQPGPMVLIWLVVSAIGGVALYVIGAAPLADIYRQLKGEDVSVF